MLVLSGDESNQAQELSEAEVNHLRRLLAWIRCEYNLDETSIVGLLKGAQMVVENEPALHERAQQVVDDHLAKVQSVPAYIRQAVKMLTKAVRDHDTRTRVVNHEARP